MSTFFAPHLTVKDVKAAMDFYKQSFEAKVLRQWNNPDGSVHVAEMEIGGALFHIHDEVRGSNNVSPESIGKTTSKIGLFVNDPDLLLDKGAAAGGKIVSPATDFDYGYRQGVLADPFGHLWLIQKRT